jgi:hypothetical protein
MKYRTFRKLVLAGAAALAAGLAVLAVRAVQGHAGVPGDAPEAMRADQPGTTSAQPGETPRAEQPAPGPGDADPVAPERPTPNSDGSFPLRPLDAHVLVLQARGIGGDKVKDAFPGRREKVNLYHDAGHPGVHRAKIDLDRDGRWDEKWTFQGKQIKRQVAPADDERYTQEFRLRGDRWVAEDR